MGSTTVSSRTKCKNGGHNKHGCGHVKIIVSSKYQRLPLLLLICGQRLILIEEGLRLHNVEIVSLKEADKKNLLNHKKLY
nr:hypothetical protein CFP56_48183 [Quercus suber]